MSTEYQDYLLHIKKFNDSLDYIYNLLTDRDYVLVFSYFYPECIANHGKGGILYYFIKENEFKTKIDDTIKKILENRYIYFEGFLEKGIYVHYNIYSNRGNTCCCNHNCFKNFFFSKDKNHPKELTDYNDNNYELDCGTYMVSYEEALTKCISMKDIEDATYMD
jgi:hypothetical protein